MLVSESAIPTHRTLQEVGAILLQKGICIGGPIKDFELMGRMQLSLMVREGIYPWSKVLDIGCGCLRGGYWLVHFLNPGGYYGIDPNQSLDSRVEVGVSELLEPETLREKQPRFDYNANFDSSVFGVKFDAFLCRSIWTHTSKAMIRTMLDNFLRDTTDCAFFLTSYLRARWPWHRDYKGQEFRRDLVWHRRKWIFAECGNRGLYVRELEDSVVNEQIWLKISKQPMEVAGDKSSA